MESAMSASMMDDSLRTAPAINKIIEIGTANSPNFPKNARAKTKIKIAMEKKAKATTRARRRIQGYALWERIR